MHADATTARVVTGITPDLLDLIRRARNPGMFGERLSGSNAHTVQRLNDRRVLSLRLIIHSCIIEREPRGREAHSVVAEVGGGLAIVPFAEFVIPHTIRFAVFCRMSEGIEAGRLAWC